MSKFCFIISTIGKENTPERKVANQKRDHVFKPALEKCGYEFKRADEEFTPGSISRQIIKRIIDSDLVIANLSTNNPNVFYELAVRNAVKKPVIIFKKPEEDLPFDTSDIRAIDIDVTDLDISKKATKLLEEFINEAESDKKKASESIVSEFTFSMNPETKKDVESEILRHVKDMKGQFRKLNNQLTKTEQSSFSLRPHSSDISNLKVRDMTIDTSSSYLFDKRFVHRKNCSKKFESNNSSEIKFHEYDPAFSQEERCPNCDHVDMYLTHHYILW